MRRNGFACSPGRACPGLISPRSSRSSTCSSPIWTCSCCARWLRRVAAAAGARIRSGRNGNGASSPINQRAPLAAVPKPRSVVAPAKRCLRPLRTSATSWTWQKPLSSGVTRPAPSRRPPKTKPPTSRSERPLNRRERADLRLPGGVVGVSALHLEQLLRLHPGAERAIDHGGLSRDHALSGEPSGSHQPCQHAAACLGRRTRLLFEQCLPQVARRDPDVLAEREQFGFGEPLADVLLAGLQLRRALDDALERFPADELARHR